MKWLATTLKILALIASVSLATVSSASANTADTMLRVSVASDGSQANGASARPSISADGRYIAFQSWASNLVPNDTNNSWDIFVRDRIAGTTARVSVDSNGNQANGSSYSPSISADGRYVAFQSDATNLVSGDTNDHADIFIHDLQMGTTTLVSLAHDGSPANGDSRDPAISAFGRFVAFDSDASNLVIGDSDIVSDVFVRDVGAGDTLIASYGNESDPGARGSSGPSISDDGQYTTFASQTTSLGPALDHPEIYVYNRADHTTSLVSVSNDDSPSDGSTYRPSISANGVYVAFDSGDATNLAPDTTGGIFLRNLATAVTTGLAPAGIAAELSADGRFVVFAASRQYLSPGDPSGAIDVYRLDRQTGTTVRVSENDNGEPGNGESGTYQLGAGGHAADVSETGQLVAFTSSADNLVPNDTNGDWDVFVKDLGPASPATGPDVPAFDGLTPAPFSTVSPGTTRIAATVQADSPLSSLALLVDGQPISPQTENNNGQTGVSTQVDLAAGIHTITISASDADHDTFRAQWDVAAGSPGETEWFSPDGTVKASQFNATMRSLVEAFRWHLFGQSWDGADHPDLPAHVGYTGTATPLETWASNGTIDQTTTTATLRSLVEAFRWHYWGISWDGQNHPEIPTHSTVVVPSQPIDPWFTTDGQPIRDRISATLQSLVESFRWHFWGYSWDGRHHPEVPTHAG